MSPGCSTFAYLFSELAADDEPLADSQRVGERLRRGGRLLRGGLQLVQPPSLQRDAHRLLELPVSVTPACIQPWCPHGGFVTNLGPQTNRI